MRIGEFIANWLRRRIGDPEVHFLFMDETQSDEKLKPRISALTGLLVPVSQYIELRRQFYSALHHYVVPKPNHIGRVPEMHGKKLPGATIDEKVSNVAAIVDLVIANRLRAYRVGYYITDYLQSEMTFDKWMLSVSFSGIISELEHVLATQMVIPVMDGFDPNVVRSFSQTLQSCDLLHAAGQGDMCSLAHSQNLIGAVSYVNSEYSVLTQVTDIVAYLRKVTDMQNDGWPLPEFKKALLPYARKLDQVMASEHIIAFTVHGKVQGPPHMARKPTGKGPYVACFHPVLSDA
jgi:hypothetical protein